MELLDAPWHPHRPALVPEVSLQLPRDRRGRERGELQASVGVEALHRLDETHQRHLTEVVERLAAVQEPAREELRQTEVMLDELVADVAVARAAVVDESGQHLRFELLVTRLAGLAWLVHRSASLLSEISHTVPTRSQRQTGARVDIVSDA
jgi:hypothetical protein